MQPFVHNQVQGVPQKVGISVTLFNRKFNVLAAWGNLGYQLGFPE